MLSNPLTTSPVSVGLSERFSRVTYCGKERFPIEAWWTVGRCPVFKFDEAGLALARRRLRFLSSVARQQFQGSPLLFGSSTSSPRRGRRSQPGKGEPDAICGKVGNRAALMFALAGAEHFRVRHLAPNGASRS